MSHQLQNLVEAFRKLPLTDQEAFLRTVTEQPNAEENAELNRRFADAVAGRTASIEADEAIREIKARLQNQRTSLSGF